MKKYSLLLLGWSLGCVLPHARGPADASSPTDMPVVVEMDRIEIDIGPVDDTFIARPDVPTVVDVPPGIDIPSVIDVPTVNDVPNPCPAGEAFCGGRCIPTVTDSMNCGGCGQVCALAGAGIAACIASRCGFRCDPGLRLSRPSPNSLTATCASDATPAARTCPGQTVTLVRNGTLNLVATTAGAAPMYIGLDPCNQLTGPEVIFTMIAPSAGTIRFELTSFDSHGMYIVSGPCGMGAGGTSVACAYSPSVVRARRESTSVEVTMGQRLTVIVDSALAAGGPFGLAISHEDQCANNIRASMRTCGDTNVADGDGCNASCQIEAGRLTTACNMNPSPFNLTDRPITLRDSFAGGGAVGICEGGLDEQEKYLSVTLAQPGAVRFELQPDDRTNVAISVRGVCNMAMGERCANELGDERAGERIDVATNVANQQLFLALDARDRVGYTLRMIPRNCGDGILAAAEQCDDGNVNNGDGCSSVCVVEAPCTASEVMMDSTPANPVELPNCGVVRLSGRLVPDGMDKDDAARVFLRAGEFVRFQVASGGPQGNCPRGVDTVVEVSAASTATLPMMRNARCSDTNPTVLCVDDAATLCSEQTFVAPTDRVYTFRLFHYDDARGSFDYDLLIQHR